MRPIRSLLVCGCACIAASFSASPLAARSKPKAESFEQLIACQAITTDALRLACFDKQVTEMKAGADKDQLVVLDKAELQKTRRSLFGFSLPKLPFLGGSDDEKDEPGENITEIDAKIASTRSLADGRWQFVLDDESTWQTTEPSDAGSGTSGMPIHLRKAALGSYFGKIGQRRAVRMKRVS